MEDHHDLPKTFWKIWENHLMGNIHIYNIFCSHRWIMDTDPCVVSQQPGRLNKRHKMGNDTFKYTEKSSFEF